MRNASPESTDHRSRGVAPLSKTIPYAESYIGKVRKLVGDQKLIIVASRAVLRDDSGNVLFVKRRDNGRWVMPSGGLELGETLFECMKREIEEESGPVVLAAAPMAIYTYLGGSEDAFEQISVQFLVTDWTGTLLKETDETVDANFFGPDSPPPGVADHYHEVLQDLRNYQGQFILREPAG